MTDLSWLEGQQTPLVGTPCHPMLENPAALGYPGHEIVQGKRGSLCAHCGRTEG